MSFRGNEVTVRIQRSEMRLRLDSHADARNDERVGHPHPISNLPQHTLCVDITLEKREYHCVAYTISLQWLILLMIG